MLNNEPIGKLDPDFSSANAAATAWSEVQAVLEQAELFWLSTVRPDGRPHVTPLIAVWLDRSLFFCTGASERKAKNLAHNARCVLTTGNNTMHDGLDVMVEGEAGRVTDTALLQRIADAYDAKYGSQWHFDVRDGAFLGAEGNRADVFEVAPANAFAFAKGDTFAQTRWRF